MTVAAQIREAARSMFEFSPADIADALFVQTYRDRKRVKKMLRDFLLRGEIERVGYAKYRYTGKPYRTKTDVIWHLVRSHRRFTATDLERLSGAKRDTVLEYLRCLRDLGHVQKRSREVWALINDPGPATPANTAKCQKLKALRKRNGKTDY